MTRHKMRHEQWAALARKMRQIPAGHGDAIRDEIRRREPGFADQMEAAETDPWHDVFASVFRMIEGGAQDVQVRPGDPGSDWVLDRIYGLYLRAICGLADGTTRACPHIRYRSPAACTLIPWANTLICSRCRPPAAAHPSPREAYTCDVCRRYERGLVMRETLVRIGPVNVFLGVCEPCHAKAEGAA